MKTSKTFTLIELILVVAIVAMLAGFMVPMIQSAIIEARVAKIYALLDTLEHACQMYHSDTGIFANEDSSGVAPWSNGLSQNDMRGSPLGTPTPGWDGPYIPKKISTDDNPYKARIGVSNFTSPTEGGNNVVLYNIPENVIRKIHLKLDGSEPGPVDIAGNVSCWIVQKRISIVFYRAKIN